MKYELAIRIARELAAELGPVCEQVEIAGGLRRGKADPHDIELVARPRLEPVTDLFGHRLEDYSLLDERLGELVEAGRLEPVKDGPRFKQFRVTPEGIVLDLFVVLPPAQWGYIMAIRTGPAHFSQWLVTRRNKNGALPSHLSAHNGALWEGDRQQRVIETPTEADFFSVLGIPMPPPAERTPRWGAFVEEPEPSTNASQHEFTNAGGER